MDEDELEGLLNAGPKDSDLVDIADLINKTKEKGVDLRNLINARINPDTEKYDGPFSHLSKPQISALSKANSPFTQNAYIKQDSTEDYVRQAADNTVWNGKILTDDENGNTHKVDFDPRAWQDSPLSSLGYRDILYYKEKPGTENSTRKLLRSDLITKSKGPAVEWLANYLQKYDDKQQYDFLVPAIDPETGNPILKAISGTHEQVVKDGYNPLNKYGLQQESDNPIVSLLKSFGNTAGETDDLLVSAAKYGQDVIKFPYEVMADKKVHTGLDDVYEDTVKDTQRSNFLSSKDADTFGSANWFMSGSGSAFASLLQFGGIGRGVRLGVATVDAIVGKQALKSIVYDKVASYGASSIMGFGSGYNEALQNGLSQGDALLYGTLVGGINSAIELKLGKDFDKYLTGGGTKQVARDILKEMNGEVSEKSAQKFLKEKAKDFIETFAPRVKNMASEGGEEVLQDVVEQTSKLTYNAFFADQDSEAYKGKFDIKEYNFIQTVSAGIFGAVAAAPFNSTGQKMASYIINGESKKVDTALDDLLTSNKISQEQFNALKSQKDQIEQAFSLHKNLFEGLSGEYADQLKTEALSLISKKQSLEGVKNKLIEGLQNSPEDSDKTKAEVEKINKQIVEIANQIAKYSKPEFLQKKVQAYKNLNALAEEARNNIFAQIASAANYEIDRNENESLTRVGTLTSDAFKSSPLARTAQEASYLLPHVGLKLDASLSPILARDIRYMKFHHSPVLNTMESRDALLGLGFKEDELALTPEEKADAIGSPEKYAARSMSLGALKILESKVSKDDLDKDPELSKPKGDYSTYDKIKFIIKNRKALGVTDAMLHSLDAKDQLASYLTPKQNEALQKIYSISNPTSVILTGGKSTKAKGAFHKESGVLFVDGILDQLQTLKQTPGSRKKIEKLQGDLFHVLAHETGHAVFDRELDFSHAAWVRVSNAKEKGLKSSAGDSINYEYFDRLLKLASMSYSVLKDTNGSSKMYFFNTIGPAYAELDYNGRKQGSLQFVKEFFAEAFSSTAFQQALDSFDLNDPKNKPVLDQFNYSNQAAVASKDSLLSQVVKAVSSVFIKLGNVLTSKDRTLLNEAFVLGSNMQFNKFIPSKQQLYNQTKSIADLSFSAYDAINVFDGERLDPDQMLATLYKRLDKAQIKLNAQERNQLLDNLRKFVTSNIISDDADEYLSGSLIVVFFKNTDDFMISWKSVDDQGETNQNRAFFSKRGNRRYINTDIKNIVSKTTLSKHHVWETFNPANKGQEADNRRAVLNNLDKAIKEQFQGRTFLEYDPDKIWEFNGEKINGQITAVYHFTTGEKGIIGYAPDLAKIRLAHLLKDGSVIEVTPATEGKGTKAYVKRNESGDITEALPTNTTADVTGYALDTISPAVTFRYSPTSIVSQDSQAIADLVDTVTPDDSKLDPEVSPQELKSGAEILLSKSFDRPRFPEFSLYDEKPESQSIRIEPGTVEDKIEYVQAGLERFLRRTMFFSKGQSFSNDDYYNAASEYVNYSKAYLKNIFAPESIDNEARLGFNTDEDFVAFAESVIQKVSTEFRARHGENRDQENWNGMGGNPSGKISVAIKADIEALNYEYDNKKHWLDFGDARDILFEAAGKSRNFKEMVSQLQSMLEAKIYAGRQQAILGSLYSYLSKDRIEDNPANDFFKQIENSYWSQFGSYIRLDAITFSPQDESAFLYFNGESSYLQQGVNDITSNIIKKINSLKDSLPAEAKSTPDVFYKSLKRDMTDFMIEWFVAKMTSQGMSSDMAQATAISYLSNADKSLSTVIDKLRQFKKEYAGKINAFFNVTGLTKTGIRFDKNRESYDRMVALADGYFAYLGIEIPSNLFELKQNERNIQYLRERKLELEKEGDSPGEALAKLQHEISALSLNQYVMTAFKESGSKQYGEYPFLVLANQVADWLTTEIENTAKDKKADLKISELKTLVKVLTKQQGNYRSPEFYFNATFNKEWAQKIRSYLDDLVSNLSNPSTGLMDKYLRSPLYKNNRFLKSIRLAKGEPIQFMISGIRGNERNGKSYQNAGDLDYLYMNLAGFVHNAYGQFYYHIDDVPSDKPRNMAFRMERIQSKALKNEIENIIAVENERLRIANDRFHWIEDEGKEYGAFEIAEHRFNDKNGKKIITYTIANQNNFDSLIPGVHYQPVFKDGTKEQVTENGNPLYQKGWIFDKSKYFYEGKSVAEVARIIDEESNRSFDEFNKAGMQFPVSTQFLKELNEKQLSDFERGAQLKQEQQRTFTDWRINYIINRYHLSQVLMGDYAYYKPDEFSDLNKRHAGTSAPFSRGVFGKPKLKVVMLKDASLDTPDNKLLLSKTYKDDNGVWKVSEEQTDLTHYVNRTDAQGYVTEDFAKALQEAYGAFSGYEKVFKPVMFGVSEDLIEYAQPLYLKLSLAILPQPGPSSVDYYTAYPEQEDIAKKIYASGTDIAVFESGVKVGVNTLNKLEDQVYKPVEFDSHLLGLQNNPYHDPNADSNFLSGMVQQTKQLGDNNNYDFFMEIYHDIEGQLVNEEVNAFMQNKFSDYALVLETVKERLAKNDYSAPIASFIDADVRVLDNPITARFAENLFNAAFKNAIALYPKAGEKLVNVSELGFSRPALSNADFEKRKSILKELGSPDMGYSSELRWLGPRTPSDLTLDQLLQLKSEIEKGKVKIDHNTYYVTDIFGNVKIFPAEILVPFGNYLIGDRAIATRIPTSKKSNSTPSVVVGFIHERQGNVIVMGKAGTAVHGFDFDVDGMFVWRDNQTAYHKPLSEMFAIAFNVLTHPKNYNDITSPTATDTIKRIADEIDEAYEKGNKKVYSKFSPERQLTLKKLNSSGKTVLSMTALASGIHSVLQQNNGSPLISTDQIQRGYLYKGQLKTQYESVYRDSNDEPVLITNVYSELLNAAADNAKLQYLGRLNINPLTAPVLFDMISRGIDIEYGLYFINQSIIQEYVSRMETISAASFQGRKKIVSNQLMEEYQNQIRQIPGHENYEFNTRDKGGETIHDSQAIAYYKKSKGKFITVKSDKVNLSLDQLKNSITGQTTLLANPETERKNQLEKQIIVLDKFLFYKSLNAVTQNAGALVSLTSRYPKTFIELVDKKRKIATALGENTNNASPQIDISDLVTNHGMYKIHWNSLSDLIKRYARFKFYANPEILKMHEALAGGKPIKIQQAVHDDFYTYILTRHNGAYNLTTSSLTGTLIDPYHFVNESARYIQELKNKYPANEFLRVLDVKIVNAPEEQFIDKAIEPSQVNARLLYEPTGELLDRIKSDFLSLSKKDQNILLGHLLYMQGFGLGGFNFSKVLPGEVVKYLDKVITEAENEFNSHFTEDSAWLEDFDPIALSGLSNFRSEVKINHPELINEIPDETIQKVSRLNVSHFDLWKGGTFDKDALYQGAIKRTKRADGGEDISFMYRKNHAENNQLVRRLIKEGVVRLSDAAGIMHTYEVSPHLLMADVGHYKAAYIELKELNIRTFKNVKQYGPIYYADKSSAYVEKKNYEQIDEQLAQSPDPVATVPVITLDKPTLDTKISIQAVRTGDQTAVTLLQDPKVNIGEAILLPGENSLALVRVTKAYNLGQVFNQILELTGRDVIQATTRFLKRYSELENKPVTDITPLLSQTQVQFTYQASLSPQGVIEHRASDMFEEPDPVSGFSNFNPLNEFSSYDIRESSGLYKTIANTVGNKLKTIPTLPYQKDVHDIYMETLEKFGFDSLQRQIILDHLNHYAPENTTSDKIADTLLGLALMPDHTGLEHYNTAEVWERGEQSPLEKLHDVGRGIFGPEWNTVLVKNFNQYANEILSNEYLDYEGRPFTYYAFLEMNFAKYIKEEKLMRKIKDALSDDDKVNALPTQTLIDYYSDIRQKMGVAEGLIFERNKDFIMVLGDKIGQRAASKSMDIINTKNNTAEAFQQHDISTWEEDITSITDFTERQAAMQEVGRLVSVSAIKADMEKFATISAMEKLMQDVARHHFAHKPKSFIDRINVFKFSQLSQSVFDWMLEKDDKGNYTGQLITRYKPKEKYYKDKVFERFLDEEGKPRFMLSNKTVLKSIDLGTLSTSEQNRLIEIIARYDGYENFFELYQTFDDEQKEQCGKDTTYLRLLWVKSKVRSEDSIEFKTIINDAKRHKGTSLGDLAQAKIALYDYLYEKSNTLLSEVGYEMYPIERGMMPQTMADFQELMSRYGFTKAKEEFLKDTQDDIDKIETDSGIVVSLRPQLSFENSKKVPYRTLSKKENFSVNVPAIFAHHFNTLIFKKHYDEVLPVMDAIQQHYIMQQKIGTQNYNTIIDYINEYANQRIFYKKSDFSKTVWSKIIRASSSMVVTQFLALAPVTSMTNMLVGMTETAKHSFGDNGLGIGWEKYKKGLERMIIGKRNGMKFTNVINGDFAFNAKALAIMNYYGIETFSSSEIQRLGNVIGAAQDIMLGLQKNSEVMVRGAAFFAEMTDEQWDSFSLNENGSLQVNPQKAPTLMDVAEWKNRIGSIQGKYDDETKRLYQGNAAFQAAMLFKGWIIDYTRSRLGAAYYDQFGIQREGYYRTGFRLSKRLIEYYKGKDVDALTDLEKQNLRKIKFDIAVKAMFLLLQGALGGDDANKENKYRNFIGKLNSQLFLLTSPTDIIKMVKNPFAGLYPFEQAAKLTDALLDLNFEQATNAGYLMLPGRQIINPVVEAMSKEE